MMDGKEMKDQELDALLSGRKAPAASADLLARLKTIPDDHAQAPLRAGQANSGLAAQFGDFLKMLSPVQLLTQSGAMAAALVIGLWVGMGEQSPVVAEEVDVAHWLAGDDMDIYEESDSE